MRFLRTFIGLILIFAILGGIGYIAWTMYFMNGTGNMNNTGSTNMPGHTTQQQPTYTLNSIAIQNKDKLNQVITTVSDAINQITIDPYSKVIVPGNVGGGTQVQPNAPVNIYPSGNNTVTVTPQGTIPQNNQTAAANTTNQGVNQNPVVYDQGKLEQLHSGIFKLSQGMMLLSQLNDELLVQASTTETNPPAYQDYVNRYNFALQNKTRLNNALSLINSASTLINVNPYGSANGYQYSAQAMEQLHRGIYKLAQGMLMASSLNQELTNQMAQAASNIGNTAAMGNMLMPGDLGSLFSVNNLPMIFTVVLIVLVISLVIGILGGISRMFRTGNRNPAVQGSDRKDNE